MNMTGKVMSLLSSCLRALIPETGFVSSANNTTVSDDYPYYISIRFCPALQDKQDKTDADGKESSV